MAWAQMARRGQLTPDSPHSSSTSNTVGRSPVLYAQRSPPPPPSVEVHDSSDGDSFPRIRKKSPSPPPVIVDYARIAEGLLSTSTEVLGLMMEYLPVRDVIATSRSCRRLLMICSLDFVWTTHFHEIQSTVEMLTGVPYRPLPIHYIEEKVAAKEARNKALGLDGLVYSRATPSYLGGGARGYVSNSCVPIKDVAIETMLFCNRDAQRFWELTSTANDEVEGKDGIRRVLLRIIGRPVASEHQNFLLMGLSMFTLSSGKLITRSSELMSVFDHMNASADFGTHGGTLSETTELEDPVFVTNLLVGLSPKGPNRPQANYTHFGRSIRLVEVSYGTAQNLLEDYGQRWMCPFLRSFTVDSQLTRFFSGPELCGNGRCGVVAVDHLRVLLVRDRIRE